MCLLYAQGSRNLLPFNSYFITLKAQRTYELEQMSDGLRQSVIFQLTLQSKNLSRTFRRPLFVVCVVLSSTFLNSQQSYKLEHVCLPAVFQQRTQCHISRYKIVQPLLILLRSLKYSFTEVTFKCFAVKHNVQHQISALTDP